MSATGRAREKALPMSTFNSYASAVTDGDGEMQSGAISCKRTFKFSLLQSEATITSDRLLGTFIGTYSAPHIEAKTFNVRVKHRKTRTVAVRQFAKYSFPNRNSVSCNLGKIMKHRLLG